LNKKVIELEILVTGTKESLITLKRNTPNPPQDSEPTPAFTDVIKNQFLDLDKQIPVFLERAKFRTIDQASIANAKLQSSTVGPRNEAAVVNKAAALLAERMAALGVKSSVQNHHASPVLRSFNDEVVQIEKTRKETLDEISAIEKRYNDLSVVVRDYIQLTNLENKSRSVFEKAKYDDGVGLVSKLAIDLLTELKANDVVRTLSSSTNPQTDKQEKSIDQKESVTQMTDHILTAMEQAEAALNAARQRSESFGNKRPSHLESVVRYPLPHSSDIVVSGVPESDFAHLSSAKPTSDFESIKTRFNQQTKLSPSNYNSDQKTPNFQNPPIKETLNNSSARLSLKPLSSKTSSTKPDILPKSPLKPVAGLPYIPPPPLPVTSFGGSNASANTERSGSSAADLMDTNPKSTVFEGQNLNLVELTNEVKDRKSSLTSNTAISNDLPPSSPHVLLGITPKMSTIPIINPFEGFVVTNAVAEDTPVNTNDSTNKKSVFFSNDNSTLSPSKSAGDSDWEVVQKEISPDFETFDVIIEFDFTGSRGDDLTCISGEKLCVINEADEWYHCRRADGKSGWVPIVFTKRFIQRSHLSSITILSTARVLYDFIARNEDELNCKSGDIVHVIDKTELSWWKIRPINSQEVGLIPSNYLEELGEGEADLNIVNRDNSPSGGGGGRNSGHNSAFEKLKYADVSENSGNVSEQADVNPFGSTFAMVVTPSSVGFPDPEGESSVFPDREEKRRMDAINEMVQTERNYVEELEIVIDEFFTPMSQMDYLRIDLLFANLLALADISRGILHDFEIQDLHKEPIGSVFLSHLDEMHAYQIYCENMAAATEYLQTLRVQDVSINNFLKVCDIAIAVIVQ
jgi:hypothetical protein